MVDDVLVSRITVSWKMWEAGRCEQGWGSCTLGGEALPGAVGRVPRAGCPVGLRKFHLLLFISAAMSLKYL